MTSFANQWNTLKSDLANVYRISGGVKAVSTSPFFFVALVISVICFPVWMGGRWPNLVLEVAPLIVGFTLAGCALAVALGGGKFAATLGGASGEEVGARFFQIVLSQIVSFVLALVGAAWAIDAYVIFSNTQMTGWRFVYALFSATYSFIAFTYFLFSLTTIVTSALSLFRGVAPVAPAAPAERRSDSHSDTVVLGRGQPKKD